jgi:hypothetical protein
MNKQEFKSIYLGNFKPDQRYIDLYERLSLYYKYTPDEVDNRTSSGYWRDFRKWCDKRGYTQEEINRCKRDIRI